MGGLGHAQRKRRPRYCVSVAAGSEGKGVIPVSWLGMGFVWLWIRVVEMVSWEGFEELLGGNGHVELRMMLVSDVVDVVVCGMSGLFG